jgi:hypothetical protein
MKKHYTSLKTNACLALCATSVALLTLATNASAQTTLANWTFESLPSTLSYLPGANTATTNFYAEGGLQAGTAPANGLHVGAATYSSPSGNGSARSLSSQTWAVGDYWQFKVSTAGYQGINVSFDQMSSNTGPGTNKLMYSTDGINFTQFGSVYQVINDSWTSSGTPKTTSHYSFDLSSITDINNQATVFFRLVDASTTSVNGGTVATTGTSRMDNFTVTGTIPGAPSIAKQPSSTNIYFGDSVSLSVTANGTAPLYYQWYYYTNGATSTNLLVDGSSGYGVGMISGSTNSTLVLTFVDTNQAGNYFLIVSNSINTATSHVAQLTVNIRPTIITNIAYLHTLHNVSYALTDTTNLYQIVGIVTTSGNLVSSPGQSCFVQDSSGGMNLFFRTGFSLPQQGDLVRVTAPLDQFQGTLEIHPIAENPTHKVEVLSSGNSLPAPALFAFSPIVPDAMEGYINGSTIVSSVEGSYVIVSNVFLALTNTSGLMAANDSIYMTNLSGQVFTLRVPSNVAADPVGNPLPGTFAASVRGAMAQFQGTGSVLTNNYAIYLDNRSNIELGTPPAPMPIIQSISFNGGNILISGTNNNTAGGQMYYVLTSTNIMLPLSQWTSIRTNNFDGSGNFSESIPAGAGGQSFYLLQAP